jgi:hypothetical protein
MQIQQIRTGRTVKGMMEKLREIYMREKFNEDEVTMTFGYILNTAFSETENINDWSKIIDSSITIEEKYFESIKENPTTKFRLSDKCANGIDSMTKMFSVELGLKAQKGYTVKQIIKAALLLREA